MTRYSFTHNSKGHPLGEEFEKCRLDDGACFLRREQLWVPDPYRGIRCIFDHPKDKNGALFTTGRPLVRVGGHEAYLTVCAPHTELFGTSIPLSAVEAHVLAAANAPAGYGRVVSKRPRQAVSAQPVPPPAPPTRRSAGDVLSRIDNLLGNAP